MADQVNIPWAGSDAKLRTPAGIAVLNVVTLGLYSIYWWYEINRELRDLGRSPRAASLGADFGRRPALSALAFALGDWVLIPFICTAVRTNQRIKSALRLTGIPTAHNVRVGACLILTPGIAGFVGLALGGAGGLALGLIALVSQFAGMAYMQVSLNRAWEGVGAAKTPLPRGSWPGAPRQRHPAPLPLPPPVR